MTGCWGKFLAARHPFIILVQPILIITLYLHTTLQQQTPDGRTGHLIVNLPAGSTLAGLINHLDINLDVENTLLVVNGRTAELSQQLSDGDQVHLIPAISGG
jgi:molybdopterin converting factor small subunit